MLDILGFYKYNTNQQMEESADMPNKDVYFAKGIEYDKMTDEGLVALANKNDQQNNCGQYNCQ